MIATTTRVALVTASTGATDWTGTLAEFFEANRDAIDGAEQVLVRKILSQGGVYHFGGGAAPIQWLKSIDEMLGVSPAEIGTRIHAEAAQYDPPDIIEEEAMEAEHHDRAEARRQGLDEISTERYLEAMRKSRHTGEG
jgi:hypothetical protein